MLFKHPALGACVSVLCVAAACGGGKGSGSTGLTGGGSNDLNFLKTVPGTAFEALPTGALDTNCL